MPSRRCTDWSYSPSFRAAQTNSANTKTAVATETTVATTMTTVVPMLEVYPNPHRIDHEILAL
jgi:hypothetical protein